MIRTVSDFFYDDPTTAYAPLPEHNLESPCYPIIATNHGYYYRRLHPEIKNIHLEPVYHHIKYKDPDIHKSELSKLLKFHINLANSIGNPP